MKLVYNHNPKVQKDELENIQRNINEYIDGSTFLTLRKVFEIGEEIGKLEKYFKRRIQVSEKSFERKLQVTN